jgi:hypothetical protein
LSLYSGAVRRCGWASGSDIEAMNRRKRYATEQSGVGTAHTEGCRRE